MQSTITSKPSGITTPEQSPKIIQGECSSFGKCSAPICPLDHPENAIWYPTEPTCVKSPMPKWIKKQRRIAKKTKRLDDYFTLKILMSTGRTGINPDGLSKKAKFDENMPLSLYNGDLSPAPMPIAMARKRNTDGLRRYQEQKRKTISGEATT